MSDLEARVRRGLCQLLREGAVKPSAEHSLSHVVRMAPAVFGVRRGMVAEYVSQRVGRPLCYKQALHDHFATVAIEDRVLLGVWEDAREVATLPPSVILRLAVARGLCVERGRRFVAEGMTQDHVMRVFGRQDDVRWLRQALTLWVRVAHRMTQDKSASWAMQQKPTGVEQEDVVSTYAVPILSQVMTSMNAKTR